jgi:hypothetical protein
MTRGSEEEVGCDIHAVIEYRENKDAPWRRYDELLPAVLRDRSYAVFAVLAGVRNCGDMPVITAPRGAPEDHTSTPIEMYEDGLGWEWDDADLHSFSWLSLKDLVEFDWDQPVRDPVTGCESRLVDVVPSLSGELMDVMRRLGKPDTVHAGVDRETGRQSRRGPVTDGNAM